MAINIEQVHLSNAEKRRAEETLKNWNELSRHIAEQNLDGIRTLLAHEIESRCRLTVIQRLTARFGVLEQQANEREVMALVAKRMAKR